MVRCRCERPKGARQSRRKCEIASSPRNGTLFSSFVEVTEPPALAGGSAIVDKMNEKKKPIPNGSRAEPYRKFQELGEKTRNFLLGEIRRSGRGAEGGDAQDRKRGAEALGHHREPDHHARATGQVARERRFGTGLGSFEHRSIRHGAAGVSPRAACFLRSSSACFWRQSWTYRRIRCRSSSAMPEKAAPMPLLGTE
jgi:hypothetical protein